MKSLLPQAELSKIDNLGLGDLNCNSLGDLTRAANTLEEVATLIDEIGLANLLEQLYIIVLYNTSAGDQIFQGFG